MSKLIKSTLENLCILVTDGTHDSPKLQDSGIPFIKAKHISNGFVDFSTCDYITYEEHLKVIARSKPEKGDILFTHIGASLGVAAYINKNIEFSIKNIALFKPNLEKIDSLYLYYLITSHEFQEDIKNRRTGSAQPFVSLDTLRKYEVNHHNNLLTQQKIAGILSAYDDLIENNTRRIEILEEMTRMLYREWFVKFRFPGYEAVRFVESELGLIPEGWEVVKIGDVAEVGRGSSPRPIKDSKYFENGKIPWIKIADATKSGKYLYETNQKVNEYGASFSRLLPKGSLILAASGTLGYTQLLGVEGCIHDGWLYLDKFKRVDKHFLYFLFKDQETFFYNSAYGAAIQNINTTILREMKFILPSDNIQNKFIKFIENNDKLIDNLARKNINLRKTRDLLLPRLISGEIDVENLDINIGEKAA